MLLAFYGITLVSCLWLIQYFTVIFSSDFDQIMVFTCSRQQLKYQTPGLTNGDSYMYLLLAPILLSPGKINLLLLLLLLYIQDGKYLCYHNVPQKMCQENGGKDSQRSLQKYSM